jgi:hypothetical protein
MGRFYFLLVVAFSLTYRIFAALPTDIAKAISSSYEEAKAKEGEEKAKNASKYGRVSMVGGSGDRVDWVGPGAEELKKMSYEERWKALARDAKVQLGVLKKESFPYKEKIIEALEEYAGYFLFWEAYRYSFFDVKTAENLLYEVAKRYPEANIGKIASSILGKSKNDGEITSLVQNEFKKLPNPVEDYKPKKDEPKNSIMNNLKAAMANSREYNRWRKSSSVWTQDEKSLKAQIELADSIIKLLDEQIVSAFNYLAHQYLWAEERPKKTGLYYLKLTVARYPHIRTALINKKLIEIYEKAYNFKNGK